MWFFSCEIISTVVGALAGALASSRVRMDLFGVLVCGIAAAVGGGTVRDLLMGVPVFWMTEQGVVYLMAAAFSALCTFYLVRSVPVPLGTLRIADALVLALFTVIGLEKALAHSFPPVIAIAMGICTGIVGGLLRDVLTGNVPFVFRTGEWYATAAFLGALTYIGLDALQVESSVCFSVGFAVALFARLGAIRWNWNLPSYRAIFGTGTSDGMPPDASSEQD